MKATDDSTLRELLDKWFSENTAQHEKITKCLFGNGEIGIVGKVERNNEKINDLKTIHEDIMEKLESIEEFNAKLSGQISLWKYLISILGVGNIASLLYFFVK